MIAWLRTIDEDPRTERVIMFLIIINAVILGLETNKNVMASHGWLLEILDHVILAVFVIEILARMLVHRGAFFRDPWSVFDFIVIGISLAPATESFTVLRALRILRALRLISAVPTLRRVVAGLLASLPGMGAIVFLIGLIYSQPAQVDTIVCRVDEWVISRLRSNLKCRLRHDIAFKLEAAFDP